MYQNCARNVNNRIVFNYKQKQTRSMSKQKKNEKNTSTLNFGKYLFIVHT